MAMNIFVYLLLALYLDQVVPDEYGTARKPWFMFTPSFWGFSSHEKKDLSSWLAKAQKAGEGLPVFEDEDPDVRAERTTVLNTGK